MIEHVIVELGPWNWMLLGFVLLAAEILAIHESVGVVIDPVRTCFVGELKTAAIFLNRHALAIPAVVVAVIVVIHEVVA